MKGDLSYFFSCFRGYALSILRRSGLLQWRSIPIWIVSMLAAHTFQLLIHDLTNRWITLGGSSLVGVCVVDIVLTVCVLIGGVVGISAVSAASAVYYRRRNR